MATIKNGNLKEKYEKKLMYLMHYQLVDGFTLGALLMFKLNFFILLGFYLLEGEYPDTFASFDLTVGVLSLIFFFYTRPKMLRGEIKAFYRRDYEKMGIRIFLIQLFILGGAMRAVVIALYYALTFFLTKDNPSDFEKYKEVLLDTISNPSGNAIAIGAFALAIYFLFYQEKYVSIREYSNRVVEIFSKYSMSEQEAVQEFIRTKDRELELENINGVKYDGVLKQPTNDTIVRNTPNQAETSEHIEDNQNDVHQNNVETIRRKARRR